MLKIALHSGSYELISFKLDMMIDTTKLELYFYTSANKLDYYTKVTGL